MVETSTFCVVDSERRLKSFGFLASFSKTVLFAPFARVAAGINKPTELFAQIKPLIWPLGATFACRLPATRQRRAQSQF
jgi:hypothetical protein